jgi:hypothetical protein
MILSTEGLSANVARVGPLVGVGPLVDEQIVGLGELAVAELADELLLGAGSAAGSDAGRDGRRRRRGDSAASAPARNQTAVERRRENGRESVVVPGELLMSRLLVLRLRRREHGERTRFAQRECG